MTGDPTHKTDEIIVGDKGYVSAKRTPGGKGKRRAYFSHYQRPAWLPQNAISRAATITGETRLKVGKCLQNNRSDSDNTTASLISAGKGSNITTSKPVVQRFLRLVDMLKVLSNASAGSFHLHRPVVRSSFAP